MTGGTRKAAGVSGMILGAATLAWLAIPVSFWGLNAFDDEGHFLLLLQEFGSRGGLYDSVYSQYGPAYAQLLTPLLALTDFSHDGSRWVTLLLLALTAFMVGALTVRISGSYFLGLAAEIVTFGSLMTQLQNPLHPGILLALILTTLLAALSFFPALSGSVRLALVGSLVGILFLTKVNIGVFAVASTVLAASLLYPAFRQRRMFVGLIWAGVLALPAAVMHEHLEHSWAQRYALHVTVSAVLFLLVASRMEPEERDNREVLAAVGGFSAAMAVILGAGLATGSSAAHLLSGILVRPLRQAEVWTVPMVFDFTGPAVMVLGLIGALAYVSRASLGNLASLEGPLRMAVGVLILAAALGLWRFNSLTFLPFAWLAVARDRPAVSHVFLGSLAVLQALHAYPGAGPQVQAGGFLLIPLGAVAIADGRRMIPEGLGRTFAQLSAGVLTIAISIYALAGPLRQAARTFQAGDSIGLPGAQKVHVPPPEAQTYRRLSSRLRKECQTFLTLPGLNSLYLFTEKRPPTGLNGTAWVYLFEPELQLRVLKEVKPERGVCVVRNAQLIDFWRQGRPLPEGPLLAFMQSDFHPIANIDGYEILTRSASKRAP